jgi:hypothetical protein
MTQRKRRGVLSAKCKVEDNFLALLGNFHFIENKIA